MWKKEEYLSKYNVLKWSNCFVVFLQCILLFTPMSMLRSSEQLEVPKKPLISDLLVGDRVYSCKLPFFAFWLLLVSLVISFMITNFSRSPRSLLIKLNAVFACISLSAWAMGMNAIQMLYQDSAYEINCYFLYIVCWFQPALLLYESLKILSMVIEVYEHYIKSVDFSEAEDEYIKEEMV